MDQFQHMVIYLTVQCGKDPHNGHEMSAIGSTAMDQAKRLKLGAIFFAVCWGSGMLWWSGELRPANTVIVAVCGAIGGYLWYLAIQWMLQAMQLHRLDRDRDAGSETL